MFSDAIRAHLQAESQRALLAWVRQRQAQAARVMRGRNEVTDLQDWLLKIHPVVHPTPAAQRDEPAQVIDLHQGPDGVWRAE